MKFNEIAHVVDNEDREMLERYLKYSVVNILNEEPMWADIVYQLPDEAKTNYVKPKMFPCQTYRVETTDLSTSYAVNIHSSYTDTIAIDGQRNFAKVDTGLKFDAEISAGSQVAEILVNGSINRKF